MEWNGSALTMAVKSCKVKPECKFNFLNVRLFIDPQSENL